LRYVLLILIFVAMALAMQPQNAAAETIKDCEKIKAADAYNQCLASFGPVAHEHELKPVPAGIGSGRLYGMHHRHYAGRHRHGHSLQANHEGHRKRIRLSVGPSGAQD
jgi:hypothetical protein